MDVISAVREKLAHALNNVWIGDFRIWAREARFDRFAEHDKEIGYSNSVGRNGRKSVEGRPVVITHNIGVRNVRVEKGKKELRDGGLEELEGTTVEKGEEEKKEEKNMLVGTVMINVEKKKNKLKKKRGRKEEWYVRWRR